MRSSSRFLEFLLSSNEYSGDLDDDFMNDKKSTPRHIKLSSHPTPGGPLPIPVVWGAKDPKTRGPLVGSVSDPAKRNVIGTHSGSYAVYRALAVAANVLDPVYKTDLTDTSPWHRIGPYPQWFDPDCIVAMDPFGAVVSDVFSDFIAEGVDVRPTIAVTKAHLQLLELREAVDRGRLSPDGNILLENGDCCVTKAAIEPVWYLPGVARRFEVDESELRRILFEQTGGMFPDLVTRSDLDVLLPPIGGMTAYIFGDPDGAADPDTKLTVRVHDECNGSDKYFARTECVAGVQDVRFQRLMPDVLHWLGITKIDRFVSMSNVKHDAVTRSGIEIGERVQIPDGLIPDDARVEMDAKKAAGYYTEGEVPPSDELSEPKGRSY